MRIVDGRAPSRAEDGGTKAGDYGGTQHDHGRCSRGPDTGRDQAPQQEAGEGSSGQEKGSGQRALTGEQAEYPSLRHVWANEVALNAARSVHSRMMTFWWKKLLWQLREKVA